MKQKKKLGIIIAVAVANSGGSCNTFCIKGK